MRRTQREPEEREAPSKPHDKDRDCAPIEGADSFEMLIHEARETEKHLWHCLNQQDHKKHPVTNYHLEQIASHLHSLLFHLKSQPGTLVNDPVGQASLRSLLDQLYDPCRISRGSAWELAGQFERQLIELGDDTYLYTLLKDQLGSEEDPRSGPKRVPTIADWKDYFPREDLERLCADYEGNGRGEQIGREFGDDRTLDDIVNALRHRYSSDYENHGGEFSDDRTRSEVRNFLRHLHLARFEDHRRDRTKIRLQAKYLRRMTPWVIGLLFVLCASYLLVGLPSTYGIASLDPLSFEKITLDSGLLPSGQRMPFPAYILLFVFSAGALGAIFGRAFELGKQSVHVGTASRVEQASFGIRAHLAQGQGILAHIVLGGTAAVVIYLALQLFTLDFPPVAYGAIGFLTGYSEPFFNRMLQDTTGMGQRIGGL